MADLIQPGDTLADVVIRAHKAWGYSGQMSDRVRRIIFEHEIKEVRDLYDEVTNLPERTPYFERRVHRLIIHHRADLELWIQPTHSHDDEDFAALIRHKLKCVAEGLAELLPESKDQNCRDAYWRLWLDVLGQFRDLCYVEDFRKPMSLSKFLDELRSGKKAIAELETWLDDFMDAGGDAICSPILATPPRSEDLETDYLGNHRVNWGQRRTNLRFDLAQFRNLITYIEATIGPPPAGKRNRARKNIGTVWGRPAECLARELLWLFCKAAWEERGDRMWPETRWRIFKAKSAELVESARSSSDPGAAPGWNPYMGRYRRLHEDLFNLVASQSPDLDRWNPSSIRDVSPQAAAILEDLGRMALRPWAGAILR